MMLAFMLLLAAVPGVHAVTGIQWGSVLDFYRDEAYVRTILEGHFGADPFYKGEHLWYAPLIYLIEAGLCKLTSLPPEVLLVRAGPWLILLAPIAFFAMVWYFRGPVTAVCSTAIYLFFAVRHEPGWAVATYTPWLIPVSLLQAFFYIELILIDKAFRTRRLLPSVWAGLGAGFTFMGHAAPGLIAVLMIGTLTAWDMLRTWRAGEHADAGRRLLTSSTAALAFVLASLPFLWYVVGYYSLHLVNRAPFIFTYYALTISDLRAFLFHNIHWVNLIGLIGLVIFLVEAVHARAKSSTTLVLWFGISLVLFTYGYAVSVLDSHYDIHLPGTAPTFHYYFYMKAALSVFAGALLYDGFQLFRRAIGKRMRGDAVAEGSETLRSRVALMTLWVIPILMVYPSYAYRNDLFVQRARCIKFAEDTLRTTVFEWVREEMTWNDVLLCNADLSCFPVMATGRNFVCTANTMPNPYVDHLERYLDNGRMLASLAGNQVPDPALFNKYQVTHLLLTTAEDRAMVQRASLFPLELHRNGSYVLYARPHW